MKQLFICLILIVSACQTSLAGITYDGTDDLISCGTGDVVQENAALTVSLWYKAPTNSGGVSRRIFHRGTILFFNGNDVGANGISFEVGGATPLYRITTNASIPVDAWTSLILTWDGSTTATNIHIYINGSEASYVTAQNGVTPTDTSGQTLYIGNRADGTRSWNENLNEFAIWQGTVLPARDIALLSSSRLKGAPLKTSVQPTRYWPMDTGVSGTSADAATVTDLTQGGNCTADNGANNTGMTWVAETVLNYPPSMQ